MHFSTLLTVAVATVLTLAPAPTPAQQPTPEFSRRPTRQGTTPSTEVRLQAAAYFTSPKQLTIEGTATVPDRALISYEVTDETFRHGVGTRGAFIDGEIRVSHGRFAATLDSSRMAAGTVEVWLGFQTILGKAKQPRAVLDLYGQMGEHMTGSQVTAAGPLKRVETTCTAVKGQGR